MDVFDLFAKIIIDTDDYIKGLGDAGKKTDGFAKKLKSGLATSAKAATAAIGAAGTALGFLVKNSIAGYGNYEQLVGGVETLFNTSADKVMEYANNAYKTAGLSANAYMETVTSFSASLLQSLGGNTDAAARYADMAITDMADNANKMGTAMESIQDAYQGFAKQNFTMLDNLKLGYGGTKEEMQRLLDDASRLSGIKYDISSYADIVDAIHVVQTEMGITGTTAAEASSTIEGSVAAAKSAWSNLVTGLGDENADIGQLVGNLIDSIGTAAGNILPVVTQVLAGIGEAVQNVAPIISEQLPALITDVLPPLLSAGTDLVMALLNGIVAALPALAPAAVDIVETILTGLLDALPSITSAALEVIVTLADGIAEALPELIPAAVDAIMQLVETLTEPDTLSSLLDAALEIILALAEGIVKAAPRIIESIPVIIKNIFDALVENVPKLLEAGLELILTLGAGIIAAIPELLAYIVEIPSAIIGGIKDGLAGIAEIGPELIRGLWEGIKNMGQWLVDQVGGFFEGLVDNVKDLLGIHSPSRVFAGIGENMAAGLGDGWDNEFSKIKGQIEGGMDFGVATVGLSASSASRTIGNGFLESGGRRGAGFEERPVTIPITLELDGAILAQKMFTYNENESARRGPNLVR